MGIFRRTGDIIAANLNDLVDRFEDPETMLRQALREMDAAIEAASTAAARSLAAEKLLARELAHHEREAAQWQARAAAAVAAGDDELAKRALLRRREHDDLAGALCEQLAAAGDANGRLRRQLDAMHAKRAEAARKLATLAARHAVAQARRRLHSRGAAALDTGAFARFDRLRAKVERAEAEADAISELVGADLSERFAQDASRAADFLDVELAKLKQSARESADAHRE
jgi:phage shock protein A